MYRVAFTEKALKSLKKLDPNVSKMLLAWVRKNLEDCTDPRQHGKALVGDHSGQWRYRVGDYRLIAEIKDDEIIILVLNIEHRKNIY
ncbi:MAG: type II toxin-antitoxin system RelE/ParE family toxin [Firmicutes bacterium]|nr:type II toxin-antitoxin system RelE/ParE family toxin [Bacillota bacterium]